MAWRALRRFLVVAALVAVIAAVIKALRGPSTPTFSDHPSAGTPPQRPTLVAVPDPPAEPEPDADAEPDPPAEPEPEPEPGDRAWADPVDGACPEGYPVKAKVTSGIFHVPGGLAYDRTKPDRCYASAAAAEADGFRAAKR